jgi:hypothetical protein
MIFEGPGFDDWAKGSFTARTLRMANAQQLVSIDESAAFSAPSTVSE